VIVTAAAPFLRTFTAPVNRAKIKSTANLGEQTRWETYGNARVTDTYKTRTTAVGVQVVFVNVSRNARLFYESSSRLRRVNGLVGFRKLSVRRVYQWPK